MTERPGLLVRIKTRVFNGEPQSIMIIISVVLAVFGAISELQTGRLGINQATRDFWSVLATILLGAGSSVFATAMTYYLLGGAGGRDGLATWGILYFGDSAHFDWQAWLLKADHGETLIFIGRRHLKWLSSHFDDLNELMDRYAANIEVYFIGDVAQVKSNAASYRAELQKQQSRHGKALQRLSMFDGSEESSDMSDLGFYWNGHSLLVKLYVGQEDRPLIELSGDFLKRSLVIGDLSHAPFTDALALRNFVQKARMVVSRGRAM